MGEIERADAMPSLATAAKLALALEVPLSSLISLCEVGTPEEGAHEAFASVGG